MESADLSNVSRETIERLRLFEQLAKKWTKQINLVSAKDSEKIWERHILDSVQIYDLAPREGDWMDIGSGGGFPGIVAAIIASDDTPKRLFTLVDSDQRKCAFLRAVTRELNLNVKVISERIEEMEPMGAEIMSARALDDLNGLLFHMERHVKKGGVALFPKGSNWKKEHEAAQENWSYKIEWIQSKTHSEATILRIKDLNRV